jgi:hypothetical protein
MPSQKLQQAIYKVRKSVDSGHKYCFPGQRSIFVTITTLLSYYGNVYYTEVMIIPLTLCCNPLVGRHGEGEQVFISANPHVITLK